MSEQMDAVQSYVASSTQLLSAPQTSGALTHTSNSIPTYPHSHNSNYIQYPVQNSYHQYYTPQYTQKQQQQDQQPGYYVYQQNNWNEYAKATAPPPPPPGVPATPLPPPCTYHGPYNTLQYPPVSQTGTQGQIGAAGVLPSQLQAQEPSANLNQGYSNTLYPTYDPSYQHVPTPPQPFYPSYPQQNYPPYFPPPSLPSQPPFYPTHSFQPPGYYAAVPPPSAQMTHHAPPPDVRGPLENESVSAPTFPTGVDKQERYGGVQGVDNRVMSRRGQEERGEYGRKGHGIERGKKSLRESSPISTSHTSHSKNPKHLSSSDTSGRHEDASDNLPESAQMYIKRVFQSCSNEKDKDRMQEKLKDKLDRIMTAGIQWEIDWDRESIPTIDSIKSNKSETKVRKSRWDVDSSPDKPSSPPTPPSPPSPAAPPHTLPPSIKSRLGAKPMQIDSINTDYSDSGNRGYQLDSIKGNSTTSRIVTSVVATKKKKKKKNKGGAGLKSGGVPQQSSITPLDDLTPQDRDRIQRRAERFGSKQLDTKSFPKITLNTLLSNNDILHFDSDRIVGTSSDLEKPYLRLTSAPDPIDFRPLDVLYKSLEYVLDKWRDTGDYSYTCEQLKSIRQDLTVQGISNEFTVHVYETHGRIALEKRDHEEFNQCNSMLMELYESWDGNIAEFTAYRLFYGMLVRDYVDIDQCLATIPPDIREVPEVIHAIKIYTAWVIHDYSAFFKLYIATPNMGGYLIDMFVQRERLSALKIISKAYRPTVSVDFITRMLAFQDREECINFLISVSAVLTAKKDQLDCKLSLSDLTMP
ncbi:hypothetical protein LOD99_2860 [Oopsacas minuta]|uniref:PCI domain-containing protein n=1 Tax=Oopsacas minuta TaxID=111878 RepID=A0AAV7JYI3_9METZ|nr:hypothetical protein LOD99_2860 [Oopsacas minuta]